MGNINWAEVKLKVSSFVRNNQDEVLGALGKILQVIIIIVLCLVVIRFGTVAIKRFFNKQRQSKYRFDEKRLDTLSTLCVSIIKYVLYFIALIMILDNVFGISPTTIITAAGVGGLAVGFGAQSLVKDVITGFFILLEDQFSVGDIITVNDMSGTVEEMGLRITKIRHYTGDLHIIPNGEITKVTNHTRGNKAAIVDVSVAYEENLDKVINVLKKVSEAAAKDIASIVEGPMVQGVINLGYSGVVIRLFTKTVAGEQWAVERELRKRVKEAFDREGIEIPYNKVTIVPPRGETK
ncbi:MAG: mechanosensitive ion channel family protein [Clostridiaceae bacterium]|nr:mechanosensitive ion channel family protein [Clostridiaceae bacterium]